MTNCVVVGDSGAGKTAMVTRLVYNVFNTAIPSTQGATFYTYGGLRIWDCSGQDRFRVILPLQLRSAHVVIYVYSLNDPSSLQSVEKNWVPFVRRTAPSTVVELFVATKLDTTEDMITIPSTMCVSSRTGEGFDVLKKTLEGIPCSSRPDVVTLRTTPPDTCHLSCVVC